MRLSHAEGMSGNGVSHFLADKERFMVFGSFSDFGV